ncbi:hypothetical protein NUSPORA_00018 [Nucleospora cyclopteri]
MIKNNYEEIDDSFNEIPNSHSELLEWINENRKIIINDPKIVTSILHRLNFILLDTENINILRKDVQIMCKTVKLEYEALLKEYRSNLDADMIIEMVNRGELEEFFADCRRKERCFEAIDFLNFNYEVKEKQKHEKTQITATNEPQTKADELENMVNQQIEDSHVIKISKIVENHKKIEYFELILDPLSFSKTIYNAFNVSLANRMKLISFQMADNKLYVSKPQKDSVLYEHGVLEITPKDYKKLLVKYKNSKFYL